MNNDNEDLDEAVDYDAVYRSPGMVILALTVTTLLHGWVMSCLWGWFVATPFNVPPLTVPHGIGLMAIGLLFTGTVPPADEDVKELSVRYAFVFYIRPVIALVLGWFVHFLV